MGQLEKLFRSWGFSSLRTNCGAKYGIYMQIIAVYVYTYIAYVYTVRVLYCTVQYCLILLKVLKYSSHGIELVIWTLSIGQSFLPSPPTMQ